MFSSSLKFKSVVALAMIALSTSACMNEHHGGVKNRRQAETSFAGAGTSSGTQVEIETFQVAMIQNYVINVNLAGESGPRMEDNSYGTPVFAAARRFCRAKGYEDSSGANFSDSINLAQIQFHEHGAPPLQSLFIVTLHHRRRPVLSDVTCYRSSTPQQEYDFAVINPLIGSWPVSDKLDGNVYGRSTREHNSHGIEVSAAARRVCALNGYEDSSGAIIQASRSLKVASFQSNPTPPASPIHAIVNNGGEGTVLLDVVCYRSLGTGGSHAPSNAGSTLRAGESLFAGQSLFSPNGRHELRMQDDGNLVIYRAGAPVWNTGTFNGPGVATMRADGNFVIYDQNQQMVWTTQSEGNAGAYLVMQDDGNLVLYAADGGVLQATMTVE